MVLVWALRIASAFYPKSVLCQNKDKHFLEQQDLKACVNPLRQKSNFEPDRHPAAHVSALAAELLGRPGVLPPL